jgi:anaerobic selenocysteine-containing dehydrogenase
VPELEGLAEAAKTKQEYELPGRVIHEPKFKTPSGRAIFHADPIPNGPELAPNQLRMMTVRTEGQFNTVVYEDGDIYRGQDRRDVILMSAADIERLGLKPDQPVDVYNEVGAMRGILVRPFAISDGCAAMYCPEANILIPRTRDPRSKTPAFKCAIVSVKPATGPLIQLSESMDRPAHASSRSRMKAC